MSMKVDGARSQGCDGEGKWQLAPLLIVLTHFTPYFPFNISKMIYDQ